MRNRLATFAAFAAALAYSPVGFAQEGKPDKPDFIWTQSTEYQPSTSGYVRFANGLRIAVKQAAEDKDPWDCGSTRLEMEVTAGTLTGTAICDDRVEIKAAWPDGNNAKVAVVASFCNGTMCSTFQEYYAVYLKAGRLAWSNIGTGFFGPRNRPRTTFEFAFQGNNLARAVVRNMYDGSKNELGDLVPSVLRLRGAGAFVDERFDQRWEPFLTAHPEEFMSDEAARAPLVAAVGPERFRAFRDAMSGPGAPEVIQGRYLLLRACMRHSCNTSFGTIVLDGVDKHIHIVRANLDDGSFDWGSTKAKVSDEDYPWVLEAFESDRVRLSICDGSLVGTRRP